METETRKYAYPLKLIEGGIVMKRRLRRLLPRVKDSVSVEVLIYMNNLEWKLRYLIQKEKEKNALN